MKKRKKEKESIDILIMVQYNQYRKEELYVLYNERF